MIACLLAFTFAAPLIPAPAAAALLPSDGVQAPAQAGPGSQAPPRSQPTLLDQVAFVGASASGGFSLEKFGPDWTLARIVQAASVEPLPNVLDAADTMLYLSPARKGKRMIQRAVQHQPTLLFALDFPFWYGYGDQRSPEARLAFLDECLELLEQFPCPIVVADFPDMRPALEAEIPMLRPAQVPSAATLEKLNARLAAWAQRRTRVTLVPLGDFLAQLRAGPRVEVGTNVWEGDALEDLLQADELHPSREGMVALALLALDRLSADYPEIKDAFLTDRAQIAARAAKTVRRPAKATAR